MPTEFSILLAIDQLAARRMLRSATRLEIATEIGVDEDRVLAPLQSAADNGLITEHRLYRGYWLLTEAGVQHLDSQLFL